MKKLAVVIGRFQPLHIGHIELIQEASKLAEKVLVLAGSANKSRSHRNPFSYEQRKSWIFETFDLNVSVMPLYDYPNDQRWVEAINDAISIFSPNIDTEDVVFVTNTKQDTAHYPELLGLPYHIILPSHKISATNIREALYAHHQVLNKVNKYVHDSLNQYLRSPAFQIMKNEYEAEYLYMEQYAHLEFPPTFNTGDAVVVSNDDQILLIKRGGAHGYGLWALPGGFLDKNETLDECIVRELKEETGLEFSTNDLATTRLFDRPNRSPIARSITKAGLIKVENMLLVNANDDALDARWFPLSSLEYMQTEIFLDHYEIIQTMLSQSEL